MCWSLPRSLRIGLIGLTSGTFLCVLLPQALAQATPTPGASAPDADLTKQIEKLDNLISQRIEAGQIAETIPPTLEKLGLLERIRGKDHWETGDARRELETFQRVASQPREVQGRYAKARHADARATQLYEGDQYAAATALYREVLSILRDVLGENHYATGLVYNMAALALRAQEQHTEAEAMSRRAVAITLNALGEPHPYTSRVYFTLGTILSAKGEYAEAEAMLRRALTTRIESLGDGDSETAAGCTELALTLDRLGKHTESEATYRRALAINLRTLGEDSRETANTYNNLAVCINNQCKFAEAEEMHRRALAIKLKILGEDHFDIGVSYINLGMALRCQGRIAEAEALLRRALAISHKTVGEYHTDTAASYGSLGLIDLDQGRYTEAEAMFRHAVAIELSVLGENHPITAWSLHNLATVLGTQGKDAECEAMLRRSLATNLKLIGEDQIISALGFTNLASCLVRQGKYAESEALHRHALAVMLKAYGEDHATTALVYARLASTLVALGKPAEAEVMHRHALMIRRKVQGEDHSDTGNSYRGLGLSLDAQGKYAEAEEMQRRAVAINLKALGKGHSDTAASFTELAKSLDRQGKHDEALRTWESAAASDEQTRSMRAKGLDAALTAGTTPLASFALALARAGQPRDAWMRWERGLARGLADEVTGRAARPLTAAEREREALLLGQAQALDERVGKLVKLKTLSQEQDELLSDLNRRASELRRQVLELEQHFESQYGALAGQPATLEAIQRTLSGGAGLIGWIDQEPYHWACLVRQSGDPVWIPIPGSGKDGAWTKEQQDLAQRLRTELDPQTSKGNARSLAETMARQRLEPLKKHLQGVKRLIVVNSPGLSGVPVDVLMAARPDAAWDGITVAYAPSASMFVHLMGKPMPRDRAPTLLALADPAYPEAKKDSPAPTPPDSGLAIARVVPNGNADLNGIQMGDVLRSYAGTALKVHADLKTVAADAGPKKVPVKYWREGNI
jgi:tetratricopeptide (TPR) repeat protein